MKAFTFKKSKGFTIIEVIIAIAIGTIFLGFATYGLLSQSNDTKVSVAKEFFISKAPVAVISYVSTRGSLGGVTKNQLVARGLDPQTPWNEDWDLSVAAGGAATADADTTITNSTTVGEVEFQFAIGGTDAANEDANCELLAGSLAVAADFPHIVGATCDATDTNLLRVRVAAE